MPAFSIYSYKMILLRERDNAFRETAKVNTHIVHEELTHELIFCIINISNLFYFLLY